MTDFNLIIFLLFALTFSVGVLVGYTLAKKNIKLFYIEKAISILFSFIWIAMTIYSVLNDKQLGYAFDIVGMGAMSHLIGLDIGNLLTKYVKGKK